MADDHGRHNSAPATVVAGNNVRTLHRDSSARLFLMPFEQWIEDEEVTEIAVQKEGVVWVERNSRWESHKKADVNRVMMESLGTAVATFSNQQINLKSPLLSASLPDGSRMQFVLPPAVEDFPSFTLRKPSRGIRTLTDFKNAGLFAKIRPRQTGLSELDLKLKALQDAGDYEEFLRLAVRGKKNIVVSGKTGSGKTTFMKGLVAEIPLDERLITIEDVRELFLLQENCVHLLYSKGGQGVAQVTPKDLLHVCLRSKPDRILMAELRGEECLDYLQTAASGHPGSITSMHAGTPALAFERMAMMIQGCEAGQSMSFEAVKRLLMLTVDIVIQFQNDTGDRYISEIHFEPEAVLKASIT